jgi:putative flippase GtrA
VVIDTVTLAVRYTLFAVIATVSNIAAQWLSLQAYGGAHALFLAMGIGTGVGLVTKYLLDKRWIFYDRSTGLAAHGRTFSLYTLMGVLTTMIFWATELTFAALFDDETMTLVGAALGLGVGYLIKYRLDRRWVFRSAA